MTVAWTLSATKITLAAAERSHLHDEHHCAFRAQDRREIGRAPDKEKQEMTTIYLVVTLFVGGVAVPGDTVEGWHRLEMPDMAHCLSAAMRGNHYPPAVPVRYDDVGFHCEAA
jgi:hypothetical protein